MKKLLLGTTNPAKIAEFKDFLSDLDLVLLTPSDLEIDEIPHETGATFEENALLKARFYKDRSGLPTLADDGGFEIDALGGKPSVYSRRWIDPTRDATDEELIQYTIDKMKGVPYEKRGAQLKLVLAIVHPDGEQATVSDFIRGVVADKPLKVKPDGFPYRALLYLPELGKYYHQNLLTEEESKKYNHRKRAVNKLKPFIKRQIIKK